MNLTSHTQQRQNRPHSLRAIAFLICAMLFPMASLAPAAPIDESYQYDALNRLATAGATTYQHDAAGNLVQITGVTSAPEIAVEQPVGTAIGDGGTRDFGPVTVNASSMTTTFTVRNTGNADLTGLSLAKSGANAGDFIITSYPASSIPGSSTTTTTFGVRFVPSASGTRTVTLHLASNDADENPFNINLSGTGEAAGASIVHSYAFATEIPVTSNGYYATGFFASLTLNFAPPTGTSLTVVKNTGLGFITGRFTNLAHGQLVNLTYNGTTYPFVANYYGGTGNDLVLQWALQDLVAWGANFSGQLGNNSNNISAVPVAVTQSGVLSSKTVVAVSSGSFHSLALCSDGTVASWGGNSCGQLGNNSMDNSSVPVLVNQSGALTGKTVVAVSAGSLHSLALCSDGTVASWGYNVFGQLGNNSTDDSPVPVSVNQSGALTGKTVVAVSASLWHSLALCSDGTVASWGSNENGQLGNNSTDHSIVPGLVNQSGVLASKTVVAVSAGSRHSLALCSDGTVASWGYNANGQLGSSTPDYFSIDPVLVNQSGVLFGKTVVAVSAQGAEHSLALCSDGTVASWGYNENGQLGNNSTDHSIDPVLVNQSGVLFGKTVVAIAAGGLHSLALCSDGTVASWGLNDFGQLGNNSPANNSTVPVLVNRSGVLAGKTVNTVAAGNQYTISLAARAVSSSISTLSNLALSTGTLSPSFAAGTLSYTVSVPTSTTSMTLTPTTTDANATTRVNGIAVASGTASGAITLPVGTTSIPVVVTAQDGTSIKTYTVAVTRAASAVATLSNLVASTGTLNPTFAAATLAYTVSVPNSTASVTLTPTKTDANATIRVNGTVVTSGTASGAITLPVGTTSIPVAVTAQDGTTIKTYTVAVTRAASAVATLSNLVASTGTLSPAFGFGTLAYTVSVPYSTSTITLTPTKTDANATIRVNNTVVASGTASSTIPLTVGANIITVAVTAQDGITVQNYTVTVTREAARTSITHTYTSPNDIPAIFSSYDASGLTVSLSLGFAPPVGTQLTVVNNTGINFIQGRFSNLDHGQKVNMAFNGTTYGFVANYYGGTGNDLVLQWANTQMTAWGYNGSGQLGDNTTNNSGVPVAVNQSGVLAGKTVVEISVGYLHSLALCSDGNLAAWGYNGYGRLGDDTTNNSSVPVAVNRSGVLAGKTVVAIASGGGHSLALCSDGTLAAWGSNGFGQLGDNTTNISRVPVAVNRSGVLAGKTVVEITASDDHNLALCSDGTLAAWGDNGYGQLGDNTTISSGVPVAVNRSGVLAGNTVVAIATGGYHSLSLAAQTNASVATLSNLAVSAGTLSPSFSSATLPYTVSVPNATSAITVTPTKTDANATIRVNGTVVASGEASSALPLSVGMNTITVAVTAQDGTTVQNYSVAVTRAASSVATLSNLVISSGTLSPVFSSPTFSYAVSVPNSTGSVTVTPTRTDANATIRVNGTVVASGTASGAISLTAGVTTTISIVVMAQDTTTTKTYNVAVTVNQPAAIGTPPSSTTINSGATTMLTVTATGTAPFTYQWYQGASGTTTTPVGTNSASFTTPVLTATTSYWVKITNAANPTGADSATATVTVFPLSFSSWIASYPGLSIADQEMNADPDHDGLKNAVEMVLGGNPATVMDSSLIPTLQMVKDPGGSVPAGDYYLFSYRRTDASAAADINAWVQHDANLSGVWTDALYLVAGVRIIIDNDFHGVGIDRVRTYIPHGNDPKRFFRLKVVEGEEPVIPPSTP